MQEQLEIVRKQFEKDKYAKSLGIVLDELTDDTIQMHMQLREETILIVEGETISVTRRTAAYLFKVSMEKEETRPLVATMKSMVYRTGKTIDPNIKE